MTLITSTNGIFRKWLEELANKQHDWDTDTYVCQAVDLGDATATFTNTGFMGQVSGVDASAVVTTADAHGLAVGDMIIHANIDDSTDINGTWRVLTTPTTTTYTFGHWDTGTAISSATGDGTAGQVINLSDESPVLADIQAGMKVGDAITLTPSFASAPPFAALDAADITITNVPPSDTISALIIYSTTVDRLAIIIESGTGFPLSTDGNNVNVTWNALSIARL